MSDQAAKIIGELLAFGIRYATITAIVIGVLKVMGVL